MTLAPPPPAAAADAAPDAALAERFVANCRALRLDMPTPELTACIARDGSMTARRDGHWLAGCSVPRLAAERMIRKESWPYRTLCLLAPTHGQQLAAVLAKLPQTNALIAVFASPDALADALACCDIAADALAGRLHVAWDEPSLATIFARHPGLAAPRQIVRLPDADPAAVAAMLPWTQAMLAAVTAGHATRVSAASVIRSAPDSPRCVLVGRQFRLWNDAGDVLARTLDGRDEESDPAAQAADRTARRADPTTESTVHAAAQAADRTARRASPTSESAARAAASYRDQIVHAPSILQTAGCDGIVLDSDHPLASADAYAAERVAAASETIADRPRPAWAVSPTPWVAWLTGGDVPPFKPAFAGDALLLTTPAAVTAARAAGWPADRVALADWPNRKLRHTPGRPVALLYDLPDLAPPADIAELSSRQIVWEAIRDELSRDPSALGTDAERYVRRAPARLGLPMTDDFPVRRFIDDIVAPAFVVGVATWLAARGVAFTLHGRGWESIDALAGHHHGPVTSRETFEAIVAGSGGVIDAFLSPAHPCRSLGVPVLSVLGRTPQRVTQDAATITKGRATAPAMATPLDLASISRLILTQSSMPRSGET